MFDLTEDSSIACDLRVLVVELLESGSGLFSASLKLYWKEEEFTIYFMEFLW